MKRTTYTRTAPKASPQALQDLKNDLREIAKSVAADNGEDQPASYYTDQLAAVEALEADLVRLQRAARDIIQARCCVNPRLEGALVSALGATNENRKKS